MLLKQNRLLCLLQKKEKLIDAPITIAVVSEQQIRKTAGGDLGSMRKTVRGVETYQVGMGRTALNVRGFMSAFNGRFVSLVDGANHMEPTFYCMETHYHL